MIRVPLWIHWFTFLVFCTSTLQGQLTANSDQKDVLCDCGYHDSSTNEQEVWTNAWILDFGNSMNDVSLSTPTSMSHLKKDFFMANYEIPAKYKDSYSRLFSANNVKIQNEALHLVVTVDNSSNKNTTTTPSPSMQQKHPATRCGAIGTKRQDILYGSFRSLMRLTNTSGTVQSMYFFHPGGEIDIEVLGAVTPPQSYFAIHPGLQEPNGRASALTHDNHHLGFDPSSGFHEYRFDWYPDRAEFYIDGHLAKTLTTNIPQTPGRFMFSHWSDGNPKFSHGPPVNDASMEIKSIVALFNTSSGADQVASGMKCKQTQTSCALSAIQKRKSSAPQQQSVPTTLEGPISNQIELPTPSDSNKYTESYLVVFLFLVGCTVLLV